MLVETGLTFINTLIKNKMIHELYIFKSNKKLGKNGKNNDTINNLKRIHPKLLTINLNGDKLLKKALIMFNGIIFNTGKVKKYYKKKKSSIYVEIQTNINFKKKRLRVVNML